MKAMICRLEIRMLGPFSVRADGAELTETAPRAGRMWRLLQMLAQRDGQPVSTDELVASLWSEAETDNPLSALQSLVYRLRSLLAARCGADVEFIRYANEGYSWNTAAPCFLDTRRFTQLARSAEALISDDPARARSLYAEALGLFRGEFLAGSALDPWAVSASSYYKALHADCVGRLCELLRAQEDWETMAQIADAAISMDFYEEDFHYFFLLALARQRRYAQLKAHYEYYRLSLAHNFGA